ncbi:hypothetical protein [Pseudomonas putida]
MTPNLIKPLSALCLALLAGCATTHTLPPSPAPQGVGYLMPIRVEVDDQQHAAQVRNGVRASGVFRRVSDGPAQPGDYSVQVHYQGQYSKPQAMALLDLFTLCLVQSVEVWDSTVDLTLSHDGQVLKHYQYHNLTHVYGNQCQQADPFLNEHFNRIGQAFGADVRRDGLVPPAR